MLIKSILLFITTIILGSFSCNYNQNIIEAKAINISKKEEPQHIMIVIQPFNDIPDTNVNFVVYELKKVYPYIKIKTRIPLLKSSFVKNRNQYRADTLIQFLSENTELNNVTIGLTTKDISTRKGQNPDWGVMGLSYCPGKACIASTFRLSKKNVFVQLFKVAIHELGHTQGLEHCKEKSCFMRDAEGKNTTEEEKYFCADCMAFLTQKGWKF